jgi:hypothetical protein
MGESPTPKIRVVPRYTSLFITARVKLDGVLDESVTVDSPLLLRNLGNHKEGKP